MPARSRRLRHARSRRRPPASRTSKGRR
jgi:hypothetical protein